MKSKFWTCGVALAVLCVGAFGQGVKSRSVTCKVVNNGIADTTTVKCGVGKESMTLGFSGSYKFEGCNNINVDFITSTDGTRYFFVSAKQPEGCEVRSTKCQADEQEARGSWNSRKCKP